MATNYAPLSFGERPKGYLEDHRMKNNQKWYTQCFVNSVPTGTTLAGDMTPRERAPFRCVTDAKNWALLLMKVAVPGSGRSLPALGNALRQPFPSVI